MLKPRELSQEKWDAMPVSLRKVLAKDAGRDFNTAEISDTYETLIKASKAVKEANSSLNLLRTNVIDAIENDRKDAAVVAERFVLLKALLAPLPHAVNSVLQNLRNVNAQIMQRANYYGG